MWSLIAALSLALAQDVPPTVTREVEPAYPEVARQQGLQGVVVLALDVDAEGAVSDARITGGVHPLLDEAAVLAARQLRFAPATRDGVPVSTTVPYRFVFSLGSSEVGGIPRPGTLHGEVTDGDGFPVPGARVVVRRADGSRAPLERTANGAGRFDVPFLAPGTWLVEVDKSGFSTGVYEVELAAGETLTSAFTLSLEDALEVVVYAKRPTWREVDRGALVPQEAPVTGLYELTRRDIESTPGSLEDITRAAHALPGVVSDGDLLAGFHVRGGEQDDVVFLLDRVPLENPFHLAGFNSLFNPDMIDRVAFWAGAAPAEVPSSTSAVMSVTSWDGAPREPGGGVDGALDLSANSARAMVMGPVDRKERFTIALAARRTYLEGYLQVLKWLDVVDTAFAAPEFGELSARAAWRPSDRHRVMLTALNAGDSLRLVDSADESLVNFDGAFELDNGLTLLAADHRWTTPSGASWETTVAWTRDRSYQRRDLAGTVERTTRFLRAFARTDVVVPFAPTSRLKLGADASRFELDASGDLEDTRHFPRWTQAGIGDFGFELATVDSAPDPWAEANGYVQAEIDALLGPPRTLPARPSDPEGAAPRTIQPALKARAGVRTTWAGLSGEVLASPRVGVSLVLPTGTIPKATMGLYQRVQRDPVKLADGYGEPDLRAERARHVVVGVDQGFPLPGEGSGGLVRVEAYRIDLSELVVAPDSAASAETWQNGGTGLNRGIDVMVAARAGRVNGQLAWGFLRAVRENPVATVWPGPIAPPQDQRHTLSVSGDLQATAHWRLTSRASFHTGRPVSAVAVADPDAETLRLTCLNCERLGPTVQLDVRAEWRRALKRHRLTFYAELLNVGNIQSDFLPIHDVIDGELSTTMFAHLPMRPFLGLRADF